MPGLVAEERVGAGREVVDGEYGRVSGREQLAARHAVARAVPHDEVVRRRPAVDYEQDNLPVSDGDGGRVELVLGERHFGRARRLAAAAPATGSKEESRQQSEGQRLEA